MSDVVTAMIGDTIDLYVEAIAEFDGTVSVSFVASEENTNPTLDKFGFFSETLPSTPTAVRTPNALPTVKASLLRWKVNLNNDARFAGKKVLVSFVVNGFDSIALPLVATSVNALRVISIGVTDNAACLRVMLHEFPVLANGKAEVDRAKLQAHVDTLTIEQRRVLLSHATSTPEGRLVVFITLIPPGGRRMRGDFGLKSATPALPNASYAVFACRDPAKEGISLVCFTEHFLVNTRNPPTKGLLASTQDGKTPSEWRSVKNPAPVQFKIATQRPGADNDGQIWSCVYASNGRNVMKHNTMHGMINTFGCWMMFRNFNWPVEKADDLERVYMKMRARYLAFLIATNTKPQMPASVRKPTEVDLAAIGYDVRTEANGQSTSFDKFFLYDRNFAYLWFFHDVVGVKYFSRGLDWYSDLHIANDVHVDGLAMLNTFPISERGKATPTNTAEEADCTTYDVTYRFKHDRKTEPHLPLDDSLWQKNALGFQTTTKFIPAHGRYDDLSKSELAECAWADMYLYE